ncbi:hypothetical protein B0H14DRAFT_3883785 [Mycena olivaceomarginata]|nr:hypothetical protein B0H14DRAFT_3883785 [Mycena olivaceomarginata]
MRVGPMDWEKNWKPHPFQLINNIIGQPTMRKARFTSRRGPDDATAVLVFQEAAHASWFIDAWSAELIAPFAKGKLDMRLDEFGRSFVQCEHRKKTDKAHLILRTLDEFDIPYLRALLDNDSRSMLLYYCSFIAERIVP